MASWLKVTLDTTEPKINLYLPTSTTSESYEDIYVVADEPLDIKHEFYIVDNLGRRYDYTLSLQKDEKTFYGRVSFHAFPKGMSKAYVQVYDKVWNRSSLIVKNFAVIDAQNVKMLLSEQESVISFENKIMPITISDELNRGDV